MNQHINRWPASSPLPRPVVAPLFAVILALSVSPGRAQFIQIQFQCPASLGGSTLEKVERKVHDKYQTHTLECDYGKNSVGAMWVQDRDSRADREWNCSHMAGGGAQRAVTAVVRSVEEIFESETRSKPPVTLVSPRRKAFAWYPATLAGGRPVAQRLLSAAERVALPCDPERPPEPPRHDTTSCCGYTGPYTSAKRHLCDFSVNLGQSAAREYLFGTQFGGAPPADQMSAIMIHMSNASAHIDAAEGLLVAPFVNSPSRAPSIAGVKARLANYATWRVRRSPANRAQHLRQIWFDYFKLFPYTLDTSQPNPIEYNPNCDSKTLKYCYYLGMATIASAITPGGVRKSLRADVYQSQANQRMAKAMREGLAVAIDGPPSTTRKQCCAFGVKGAWDAMPALNRNTPTATYVAAKQILNGILAGAVLEPGACGGTPGTGGTPLGRDRPRTRPKPELHRSPTVAPRTWTVFDCTPGLSNWRDVQNPQPKAEVGSSGGTSMHSCLLARQPRTHSAHDLRIYAAWYESRPKNARDLSDICRPSPPSTYINMTTFHMNSVRGRAAQVGILVTGPPNLSRFGLNLSTLRKLVDPYLKQIEPHAVFCPGREPPPAPGPGLPDPGPAMVALPNIENRPFAEAKRMVRAIGLGILKTGEAGDPPTPDLSRGVAVQSPKAGSRVSVGSVVEVLTYAEHPAATPQLSGCSVEPDHPGVRAGQFFVMSGRDGRGDDLYRIVEAPNVGVIKGWGGWWATATTLAVYPRRAAAAQAGTDLCAGRMPALPEPVKPPSWLPPDQPPPGTDRPPTGRPNLRCPASMIRRAFYSANLPDDPGPIGARLDLLRPRSTMPNSNEILPWSVSGGSGYRFHCNYGFRQQTVWGGSLLTVEWTDNPSFAAKTSACTKSHRAVEQDGDKRSHLYSPGRAIHVEVQYSIFDRAVALRAAQQMLREAAPYAAPCR